MCSREGNSVTRYKLKLSRYVNKYSLFCYKYDRVCCIVLTFKEHDKKHVHSKSAQKYIRTYKDWV